MHDRTNPSPVQVMPPTAKCGPIVEGAPVRTPTPPAMPPDPWVTSAQDSDRATADLSGRFPSATIWFGEYTGSYWAFIQFEDCAPRLIEAATPADLERQLDSFTPCPLRRPSPSLLHSNITKPTTPCPSPDEPPSRLRRASRGRVRCCGRHSMPRTLSRSGRC
jgi:hypothetical protein